MNNLTKEKVLEFLKNARPDLNEDDWKKADVITVLKWAIPTYFCWNPPEINDKQYEG